MSEEHVPYSAGHGTRQTGIWTGSFLAEKQSKLDLSDSVRLDKEQWQLDPAHLLLAFTKQDELFVCHLVLKYTEVRLHVYIQKTALSLQDKQESLSVTL